MVCGAAPVSRGTLLGGRVRYDQTISGHRSGIEPVLLAASVPARPGERVLEGGCGAGAALLCLAHRVPGIVGLGIERDAALVDLARANAAANGFSGLSFAAGEVEHFRVEQKFDHACANPPWHAPAGTASPDAGREGAKRADAGLFARWAVRLAAPLRHHGTLTVVTAVATLPEWVDALAAAGCGGTVAFPLWPKPGSPAKLLLLRAMKGGRGAFRLLPGLTLHHPDGGYSDAATAILRDGVGLGQGPLRCHSSG